jgi:glycine C-acetyltransferase
MALEKIIKRLSQDIKELKEKGTAKGKETVIMDVIKANKDFGPRYLVEGEGEKQFIKMNANSYLGFAFNKEILKAEEEASKKYGIGPGAVRFISGTNKIHTDLEERLAKFHNREAAMIFSSAYVTSMGVLVPLTTEKTVIVSDELNHNCIINAMKLSRPAKKLIYKHNDMEDLKSKLDQAKGLGNRVLVVSDGIFSMRGDNAPLKELVDISNSFNSYFEEGVFTVIDDSHGVGAIGKTGRGTEEYCNTKVDILIGTLGKAYGVNGGYVTSSKVITDYLRETAPMYIYSNPITAGEAGAVLKALDILDSEEGLKILKHVSKMTLKFENGLKSLGFETIEGAHPVVPLMVRDTEKTTKLVKHLKDNAVLATGLNYPVVPKGSEEIRFQISGEHTEKDIDIVLDVLKTYK